MSGPSRAMGAHDTKGGPDPIKEDGSTCVYRTIPQFIGWIFRTTRPNIRWTIVCWCTAVLILTCAKFAKAVPVQGSVMAQSLNDNPELMRYWNKLESYLTKYGYMMSTMEGGGNLMTEDRLRDSIRIMQKFGNIPVTGKIDSPTIELLSRRRCGMPDMLGGARERVRRFALQGQKWTHTNLTWSIREWPPRADAKLVRRELAKAFKVWSDASKLEFEEIRSAKADILVSFFRGDHNDDYPFDGRGIVLAHAFFPGEGIGGDAHFDAEEPWTYGESRPGVVEGVSLFAVAAHEFGHSLGLSHSSVSGSLMNPFYQIIKDNFKLPRDDTFGIQSLYDARTPTRWEPFTPYYPDVPPVTPRPTGKAYPVTPRTSNTKSRYSPTKATPHPHKPHTCNTTFDAVTMIRSELFIFKGNYFWRPHSKDFMQHYPVEIHRFFEAPHLNRVDAVYERPMDKVVFFSGKQYWLFRGNKYESGPRPLTDLGLPPHLHKIDAAMVWGYNGKTYLFSGTQYWRYDETEGRVELDYPRDMSMWRGVPYHIDAAFRYVDGRTYFFKGRKFWEFNDQLMKVRNEKPKNVNHYWLRCSNRSEFHTTDVDDEEHSNNVNRSLRTCSDTTVILLTFVILYVS